MSDRSPVPLAEVARLEERRLAVGVSEVADLSIPFAGGRASRGAAGAWTNSAIGAGFDGPVTADAVAQACDWYESAGIEPRVEVAPFAHPTLIEALGRHGFVLRAFENVFMHSLADLETHALAAPPPEGITIEIVDPGDARAVDEYARVVLGGFMPAPRPLPEGHLETYRRVARHPRTVAVVAREGGRAVGGGAVEVTGAVGALFGLSVAEGHRRRGIQLAMMAWRLRLAAERGATVVTISARPNVPTERNARRVGFAVAYTRAILVRPGEGLAPVDEA